ncbi:MAG: polyhydroxyalkanoic acid system family protein [Pacificimonas sp.]
MEKTFTQEVAHGTTREEAKEKLQTRLPELLEMLPGGEVEDHWVGDTMLLDYRALGQQASAQLQVLDDRVVVSVTVSGFLAAMGDKIGGILGRGTKTLLEDKSKD